ncbi:PLAT domain-containing protein 3-like isoform X2 [Salvia hispanica]|uniref:PLAT domain-containing protein 3-like isoform X2 n=1 Tax=Salvia hispanica TaxID=49212 RepID=UPI002009CB8B|nr:PLAT domain-containing protein 3-like isoform X2 [Salvia hispanica]
MNSKKIMGLKYLSFNLLILFSFFIYSSADEECLYDIYIQTGSVKKAGTHSTIGLTLSDALGAQLEIPNLEDWGLMGPGFNYFETGELNIFGGKGPCLTGPICGLNLTSDGSGPYAGWYCEFVKVSAFGLQSPCSQQNFAVEQWLAKDEPPYELTAAMDVCLRSARDAQPADKGLRLSMVTPK